jgi:hypothetical protein
MRGKKERTGRHEPSSIPAATQKATLTAYHPLCPGLSSAAHGIHNPPWRSAFLGMNYLMRLKNLYRNGNTTVKGEK